MHEESRSVEMTLERLVSEQGYTRAELRQLREDVRGEFREVREDIRRLDNRIFQTLLGVLATLATALGALVAVLA